MIKVVTSGLGADKCFVGGHVVKSAVYDAYKAWVELHNYKEVVSPAIFGRELNMLRPEWAVPIRGPRPRQTTLYKGFPRTTTADMFATDPEAKPTYFVPATIDLTAN